MCEHILIGSGAFGLGFVGDVFINTGKLKTSIVVANRGNSIPDPDNKNWLLKRNREYNIVYTDGGEEKIVGFDVFECDFNYPVEEIVNLFCTNHLKLVTVSVPLDALKDVSNLLIEGLKARAKNNLETPLIITCINGLNNGTKLHYFVSQGIPSIDKKYFPICVVDRVCLKPEISALTITVKAERHASLIVQEVSNMDVLDKCNEKWIEKYSSGFLTKSQSMALPQKIKYIGVNGMHLFIAAVSKSPIYSNHLSNEKEHLYLKCIIKDPHVKSYIDGFINEVSKVISEEYSSEITLESIKLQLEENLARFRFTEDTNERLLKELRLSKSSASTKIKDLLNDSNELDELLFSEIINDIVDHIVGTFLRKVDLRVLDPIFKLYQYDKTMPTNLTTGASCVLHAMAKQVERVN